MAAPVASKPELSPEEGAPGSAPALPSSVWRASQLGSAVSPSVASGFATLDAELPGAGWPLGTLTELIAREPGIGELRLLVPLLRQLTRERRVVVLLAPPHVPYAPALESFGIDLDHLLVVQASHAADRLWAVEQTLRSSGFGALLAWLPQEKTRPEHLRRMQLAAQGAQGPAFLFRTLGAQFEPSPAPLRLLLLPKADQRLSVQILKRRGPVLANPLLLDLPRPVAAIHLKSRAAAPEPLERSLATIHSRQPAEPRAATLH
jgi:protein ImuA